MGHIRTIWQTNLNHKANITNGIKRGKKHKEQNHEKLQTLDLCHTKWPGREDEMRLNTLGRAGELQMRDIWLMKSSESRGREHPLNYTDEWRGKTNYRKTGPNQSGISDN